MSVMEICGSGHSNCRLYRNRRVLMSPIEPGWSLVEKFDTVQKKILTECSILEISTLNLNHNLIKFSILTLIFLQF